jgi:exonuclease III
MGKEMKIINQGLLAHERIISAVETAESVSDVMSHTVLRGRWCDIIAVEAHPPTEDKSEHSKDSFYEKLEQVFGHFTKYHTKILSGDFNAKLGRKDIFKQKTGNESLHKNSNDMLLE